MAEAQAREKEILSVDQQIEHLKLKGVTFELCSEKEAARYLAGRTYYFKIASCRALFEKRVGGPRDGEYINLDLALAGTTSDPRQQLRGPWQKQACRIAPERPR